MRDFPRLLDDTAKSLSDPLLELIVADCVKLRVWARDHSDYAASSMFDVAISHLNAEIAWREESRRSFGVG